MWLFPRQQYGPLSSFGVVTLCITVLYALYVSHSHSRPAPPDPIAAASAVESQLAGAQTVGYASFAPGGKATGVIQQAICSPDATVSTQLTCTVLFDGQTGSYAITVITDGQGDWRQLCQTADLQAGRLCRAGAAAAAP